MSVIGQLLEAQQERAMDLIFLGNSPKDAREYGRLSEQIMELRAKLRELMPKLEDEGNGKQENR